MPRVRKGYRSVTTAGDLPRQPVLELAALGRRKPAPLPSLIELPNRVLTRSGRSALVLALELLGLGAGDRVLVPTYHCPTMIAPVERLGAMPAFYPINSDSLPNMDYLASLDTTGVRAMLVAHFFGIPRSLEAVATFCRERGIALIEDCAHCWFGRAGAVPVGTTGDFAIGSLTKFFPVMEGGLLASVRHSLTAPPPRAGALKNEARALWDMVDIASRANRLGVFGGAVRALGRARGVGQGASADASVEIRAESLRDPLLPPARLTQVESWVVEHWSAAVATEGRRRNYNELASRLSGVPGCRVPWPDCGPLAAPYVMPLLMEAQAGSAAYSRMRALRLPVFRWDRIWPGTPAIEGDATRTWATGLVQITCHESLRGDIARLAAAVKDCLARGSRSQ
jgi:perosamine synthetase